MRRTYHLDWLDGCLCIKYAETHFNEPKLITLWWPAYRCHRPEVEHLIGREAFTTDSVGYSYRLDHVGGPYVGLTLIDSGKTKAIRHEVSEISPPKVRKGIEVRYRIGRWEKYLKTQGWVVA